MTKNQILEIIILSGFIVFIIFLLDRNSKLSSMVSNEVNRDLDYKEDEIQELYIELQKLDTILGMQTHIVKSTGESIVEKSYYYFQDQLEGIEELIHELKNNKYRFNPQVILEKQALLERKIAKAELTAQFTSDFTILNQKIKEVSDSCHSANIDSLKIVINKLQNTTQNKRSSPDFYKSRIIELRKALAKAKQDGKKRKSVHYAEIARIYQKLSIDTRFLNWKSKDLRMYFKALSLQYSDSSAMF